MTGNNKTPYPSYSNITNHIVVTSANIGLTVVNIYLLSITDVRGAVLGVTQNRKK